MVVTVVVMFSRMVIMRMANDATRQPTAVLANLFAVALVFALLFEALRRRPLVLAPSGEGRCDAEKQEEEGGRHGIVRLDAFSRPSASCRVTLCVPIALFAALPAKNGSPERTR